MKQKDNHGWWDQWNCWLHLSLQAASVHTEQLRNLKAQVRNEMGEGGLAALNKTLERRHLDGDTSTKLFSGSELRSLEKEAANTQAIDVRKCLQKPCGTLV